MSGLTVLTGSSRNKRDQWVVYDGKTEAEVDAGWAGDSGGNAIDLSAEMDEARTIAEALCAPAALSYSIQISHGPRIELSLTMGCCSVLA